MFWQWLDQPLILPVILPALAGILCLLIPRSASKLRSLVAVVASALTLVLAVLVFELAGHGLATLEVPAPARATTKSHEMKRSSISSKNGATSACSPWSRAGSRHVRSRPLESLSPVR